MSEKVVVITGASAGIGAALAHELGGRSHRLALCARRFAALEQVTRDAEAQGSPEAVAMVADVTHRNDVENVRDEALEPFGRIDVWINNAGRGIWRGVLELTDDDVDSMMDINVKSALYGRQTIVPYFVEQGSGHLINISSFLGRVPITTARSAYSRPLPPAALVHAQAPSQVAAQMADLIDHPRPELVTNSEQYGLAERYYADVGAFEAHRGQGT